MISMYHVSQIRALIDQGLNNSEISRRLKIDRATVRKYRISNDVPRYTPRQQPRTRINPLEEYEALIAQWMQQRPDLSATSIFLFIQNKGYSGSLRTVERRVGEIKAAKPKERYFEQEYTPGEQSQFDFKESVTIPFTHGETIGHLFIATLPYSDCFFAKAFPNKTYEAFADGFHSFFEFTGGMTESVRFDNLTPVVKKVLKGSNRLYTAAFDRALEYYGFKPLPCAPAKGNEKGDVERDIRTFARRISELLFLSGQKFNNYTEFNAWLETFSSSQLTESKHERFTIEAKKLKPLPPRDEAIICQVHIANVSKLGTASIGKTRFSVPDHLILRDVKLVVSAYDVKIYQITPKVELVATHPRIPPNTSSILLEHCLASLIRKPQAMIRWVHKDVLFPEPVFQKYYRYLQSLKPVYGAESGYLKSLNLIQNAALTEIAVGMELVMQSKSVSPFDDLRALLSGTQHFPSVNLGEQARCQPPLNTELSHYDSLIPA